ncbi:MAG: hypothetical protein Q4A62_05605 [Eikenella sp.]|nr:hypothetical protein [Eikenella sp.]
MPDQYYAPRYSLAVRIRFAVVFGLIACWLHFIFFPAFHDFANHADCRNLWGIPGYIVVFYGSTFGPALLLVLFAVCLLPDALRILHSKQYPPPGRKTWGKVRVRHGWPALWRAWLGIALLPASLGLVLYAVTVADDLTERYRAAQAKGVVCESEKPVP